MPYNAPPTFFVPGTWEAGSSNSYKERMEKKYEKNNGRNSDWYDDRGKDDNTDSTSSAISLTSTSTSSSERSAWHPTDNSYTKNKNQNNVNNEDNLLSNNNNDADAYGSTEDERYDNNNNKNVNINNNNNRKNDNTDHRKSNVQYAANQVLTNEKAGTANTEIIIDIKQILEMEKAKKQAKKFNKKSKVATYWEENPELTGTRYSNTVRQGGDGIGIGAGAGVERVGEDGGLVTRSSAEQGGRSSLSAHQSNPLSFSTSTSSSVSSFSTSATTSLSTSTLKRVESCESFYLSVYFYFPHLRAFLIQIRNDHQNKNDVKKKKKKSERDKIMKICDTDFKFHGNGHQIFWRILEKMESEMREDSEGIEEGEGGESLTPVPIKSNGMFDANSFLKEVELFISNPNEYFQPMKISNNENECKNENENESNGVNKNNENSVSDGDRGDDNNADSNDRDSNEDREKEMEREKDSKSNSIRDRLEGREKNNNRDGNNSRDRERDRDSNREKERERGRREYAYLSASALEMIQGKKVIGKSKLSIEFAIQDGQRIVLEYEARKEQIELLSKFRTGFIPNQLPLKNMENVTPNPESTEIQNFNEKRIFLTEESFNSENIFFNTLEDRNLDSNIEVSKHAQQASVSVSSVSGEGSREGDSRGIRVMTNINMKSSLIEKEVEKKVEVEEEIGLEEYLEQLLIVEQRTSSLSQERAERSSSLWEDYINRVRNNRIDGISDEPTRGRNRGGGGSGSGGGGGGGEGQREGEGVQGDGGEEGEGEGVGDVVDSITMQDTEMLFYLQSPDDTDTLDNHHNNDNNNDTEYGDKDEHGGDRGEDGVLEKGYTNSQYAFNFDGDAGAILEEGAYMDEREKDQVIESRARKSSGKYRSVLWSAVSCGVMCWDWIGCDVLWCAVLYCIVLDFSCISKLIIFPSITHLSHSLLDTNFILI